MNVNSALSGHFLIDGRMAIPPPPAEPECERCQGLSDMCIDSPNYYTNVQPLSRVQNNYIYVTMTF